MKRYDVLVIGGGIAGVSIGYELAADRTVGLLDMEATLAFHTTGRSVATFLESYGGRTIRLLTSASRAFMENPPEEFGRPLLKSLPLVWAAPHGEVDDLRAMHDAVIEFVPSIEWLSSEAAIEMTRVLRPEWVAAGLFEPGAREIDVAALHAAPRRRDTHLGGRRGNQTRRQPLAGHRSPRGRIRVDGDRQRCRFMVRSDRGNGRRAAGRHSAVAANGVHRLATTRGRRVHRAALR
jgi:glycine/D-amino acid oxidase-like deaminating enzyme